MIDIQSIEKRFPWSFLGFILGTISLIIAFFFFYLSKREVMTNLRFVIDDEFKLIELKEKLDDVRVLFKGEDIINAKKEIKIIRFSLHNQGRPILQSYFDQTVPFGIEFEKSIILSSEVIESGSEYLKNNLYPTKDRAEEYAKGQLIFGKPIIEKNAKAIFKVYILQDEGIKETKVSAFGKVSGMEFIPVDYQVGQENIEKKNYPSLVLIGICFASGYFGMFGLVLTVMPISFLLGRKMAKLKEKKALEFLESYSNITDDRKKIIFSYIKGWPSYYLRTIRRLLYGDIVIDTSDIVSHALYKYRSLPMFYTNYSRIRKIIPLVWSPEIFKVDEKNVSLVEDEKEFIREFLVFLGKITVDKSASPKSDPNS